MFFVRHDGSLSKPRDLNLLAQKHSPQRVNLIKIDFIPEEKSLVVSQHISQVQQQESVHIAR